jgi:hypothetical protein
MGISPAPPWETIFFALHKRTIIPQWENNLLFYRRFIDDIFGIWIMEDCPIRNKELWTTFQTQMQQWHGLSWEFSSLSRSCNFMDLTISIDNKKISTTFYKKPQNLYLYIPPSSTHPKGLLCGLITGSILQFYRLCTNPAETHLKTQQLYSHLIQRDYTPGHFLQLFSKAHNHAMAYISCSPNDIKQQH